MVRHLRMQAYTDIFAGDPTWVTESIGGRFNDGRTKVTKTSFRFLQTLYNLGPSPEPNLTVLWSRNCRKVSRTSVRVSIDTSSIQYENDDLMREVRNSDDYGIACCVSYQDIGRHISSSVHAVTWLRHCCWLSTADAVKHRHTDGKGHSGIER